ncbi:methyltransferase [Sphingomonas montanisoli]|uniref:Methyltransferase n=1 Tax=Sphingomonas montanisoli TaxID=2606412 RepID=A0A5D9C6I6_9SPHN|nr:methyltransferase [Sphingomonas montanisoli]TZG25605.1 methyltransferase [Sphingomonas montanisoli]
MAQNTSTAVMQRRVEAHDSLDDFPTPPWATRALCDWLMSNGYRQLGRQACREPAANRGHMVMPLSEYFGCVEASDIHDYGAGFPVEDYLFGFLPSMVDWTITNPPFRLAAQFIERMAATSRIGFAVLVRAAFLESVGRYEAIFSDNPPSYVLQFCERVVMHKGRLAPEGSTATAYAWLVWIDGEDDTRLRWIAPCRKRLERDGDYPTGAAA